MSVAYSPPAFADDDAEPQDAWGIPLYALDYAALLDQCVSALARRRTCYPEMIEQRTIEADLAARDIAAWEWLVGEWTWVVHGEDAPGAALPPRWSTLERLAAVDLAQARVDQELKRGRRGHDLLRQSHVIQALHWHLMRRGLDGQPEIHRLTRLNRSLRAHYAANAPLPRAEAA